MTPNIATLVDSSGADEREVRLWVVSNEVAFRAVSQLPWVHDHVHLLATAYADAVTVDPAKWKQFQSRYRTELREKKDALTLLKQKSKDHTVTLLYGAKDKEHNEALVLKRVLEGRKRR